MYATSTKALRNFAFLTHCIYEVHMTLTVKSHYYTRQHLSIDLSNGHGLCSLCSRNGRIISNLEDLLKIGTDFVHNGKTRMR